MPLEVGTRLGHFEILALLGKGGMGEVYRARDSKLDREVAIKVLPDAVAEDSQRLSRFQREATLLAALNHPHIASIYGVEEADGRPFLVLELAPGEDLSQLIRQGPIPIEDAVEIARQIAEALEEAHEKGIVHRDLKPGNVKISPDGGVKVLDFGLAKAFGGDETSDDSHDASQSPTMSRQATEAGVILGTAAYMSPEQARGKPVDRGTDIWALGCVLFETLTGRSAFAGETTSDTIGAILRAEPDWSLLPSATPVGIRALLERCLRKDRKRRLRDAGDVRIALEEAATEPLEPTSAEARDRRRPGSLVPWSVAAVSAVLAAAAIWGSQGRSEIPPSVSHATITVDQKLALSTGRPVVALSPDGAHLVYVADTGTHTALYIRKMNELDARMIPGTEGASGPFFSPDGQSVGFISSGTLKKVAVSGGAPVAIQRGVPPVTGGAAFSSDGSVIMNYSINSGLARVVSDETEQVLLTEPSAAVGEGSHRWPHLLPGEQTVLLVIDRGGSFDEATIAALSLDTGEIQPVIEGGTQPVYVETGHLVFARNGVVLAAPFDLSRLTVSGPAVPLLDGVATDPETGAAHYAVSRTGSLVYVRGAVWSPEHALVRVTRSGVVSDIFREERSLRNPAVSPDGSRIALTISDGSNSDVWMYEMSRGALRRLTFDPGEDFNPVWSPDGERIALASETTNGSPQIHWLPVDGSAAIEPALSGESSWFGGRPLHSNSFPTSWSSDGELIAVSVLSGSATTSVSAGNRDIWLLPRNGEPRTFTATDFQERGGAFSPNAQFMAYHSDQSGRPEVYVQAVKEPGRKWLVSTGGGQWPVWSRDGAEIYYRGGRQFFAVGVRMDPEFSPSPPEVLFEGNYTRGISNNPNYSITPEGDFIMVAVEEPPEGYSIGLVANWFEELKAKTAEAGR